MLKKIADDEDDSDCLMRVKRAAINCCRLYVGQISDAKGLTFGEKRKFMDLFAKSIVVRSCWDGYPVKKLPFQQRVFQSCMQQGYYRFALILIDIRKMMKRISES